MRKYDYELLAAFRYALRKFLRFSEAAAERAGITPQQYLALLAIKGFPERDQVTVGELAERLQIRHHSAVGLADRLVAQRLVGRRPGRADRRQVYLALSARGEQVLANLASAHRAQLRTVGRQLNAILRRLTGDA